MSDDAADTTERHPLVELILQLTFLGRAVRQLVSEVPSLARTAQRWTLCFNMDGSLAGIVDADVWRPAGKQLPRISDLLMERQLRLAQVGLVSKGEHLDMGPTYEGIEWDLQAAERGVQLPYLAQPLDTDSDAYREAYSESWEYTEAVLSGRHGGPEATSKKRASEAVEATELADQIAGVLQQIGFVSEYVRAAEVAAQQLPGDALAALDGLDRSSWRARLRRQVLAEACQWPIDATDHSRSLPTRDESLIALVRLAEPIGHWQDLLSRIDHAVTDLRAASSEITSKAEDTHLADGPLPPDGWVHDGTTYKGLTAKPWTFARALWNAERRSLAFSELAEPVNGDHEKEPNTSNVRNWANRANKFFDKHSIPWAARVGTDAAILEKCHMNIG